MKYAVVVEPEAIAEITAAGQWYERQRSGLGVEFSEAVWQEIEGLGTFPNAGSPVHGVDDTRVARQVRLRRYPYLVVYAVVDEVVQVVAVAHERQLPGYWVDRLRES